MYNGKETSWHPTSHLASVNSVAVVKARKTFHLEQGMPAGEGHVMTFQGQRVAWY